MKSGLLFWGFQDLKLIAEIAKKARYSLNIRDFYIQINDLEKTVSLMEVFPEEIIRTKHDFGNLYQWLVRNGKKNVLVIVDLFRFSFIDNSEENYSFLNKILELNFKICFIAPKILYPQSINFINNVDLSSIYQNTIEHTKIIKFLYEIIINSKANVKILGTPILETFVLNRENYYLFKNKKKFYISFIPKILTKFNTAYISQNAFVLKLVEAISSLLSPAEKESASVGQFLTNIEADCTTNFLNTGINTFAKLLFPVSLERFFNLKSSTRELKFILWLMYLSICEYDVQLERSQPALPMLGDLFFSSLEQ